MPYIGLRPPASPVDSSDIASGAVANTDLAVGAVTTHSIAAGAIDAGDIGTGGVSANTQLAAGVVTAHATAADIAAGKILGSFLFYDSSDLTDAGVDGNMGVIQT